jgi:parvulin-like peptidyl-prolyl isomerase
VVTLAPDRYGVAPAWDAAAERFDLVIHTSPLFSAYEEVPSVDAGPDFNAAAFALEASDPERYFSDPVNGSNAVYVMAAHERAESRVPEFEEVRDEVMPLARREAETEALEQEVNAAREAILSAMATGRTFTAAAQAQGFNVSTTESFTVYEGLPEDFEYAYAMARGVMSLQQGDVSEPLPVAGGALLVYAGERRPGDLASRELLRPELARTLDRYRAGVLYDAWTDYLLAHADYEDFGAPAPAAEETAEPETEPAEPEALL